jgi:hypothetical protein
VAELLHHYGEAHHALQIPEHGIRTAAAAKALDGRFDQRFASGGSTSILVFPSTNESHVAADTRIRARSRRRVGALRVESTADNPHNYARRATRNGAEFSHDR